MTSSIIYKQYENCILFQTISDKSRTIFCINSHSYIKKMFQDAMKYNSMMSNLYFHLFLRWRLYKFSLHRHWKHIPIMSCFLAMRWRGTINFPEFFLNFLFLLLFLQSAFQSRKLTQTFIHSVQGVFTTLTIEGGLTTVWSIRSYTG